MTTPAALGYRMPAEWEPHAATWLAWPHERSLSHRTLTLVAPDARNRLSVHAKWPSVDTENSLPGIGDALA